jgi:hypothetical protein
VEFLINQKYKNIITYGFFGGICEVGGTISTSLLVSGIVSPF